MLKHALIFLLILLSLLVVSGVAVNIWIRRHQHRLNARRRVIVLCPPSVLVVLNQKRGQETVRVPDVSLPQTPSLIYFHHSIHSSNVRAIMIFSLLED